MSFPDSNGRSATACERSEMRPRNGKPRWLARCSIGSGHWVVLSPIWSAESGGSRDHFTCCSIRATTPYEYDFGDSWEHELLVEKILPRDEGKRYPVCLTGKRACPPEDCGGILGYASFLEAIRDPEHPEHDEMLEWVGGEFDPDIFDLDEVNRELQQLTNWLQVLGATELAQIDQRVVSLNCCDGQIGNDRHNR